MAKLNSSLLFLLTFAFTAFAQQRLVSVDPDHAYQDEVLDVWIVGEGTHFAFNQECRVIGAALVKNEDHINGFDLRIANDELMTARFDIPNQTSVGAWDVQVLQDPQWGLVTLEEGFDILSRTILLVPQDYETIEDAIASADENDTILVAPGIYSEAVNFVGKSITVASYFILEGKKAYIDSTVLDGSGVSTVVTFGSGETNDARLIGFTIQNGFDSFGGGIYCHSMSSPTIRDCYIVDNVGRAIGGGIYCYSGSSPIVINCLISGNSTMVKGGGIACRSDSEPVFINCTIADNTAMNGGGIYCLSGASPKFINSIFWGNSGQQILFNDAGSRNSIYLAACDIQGGEAGVETSENGDAVLEECIDGDPLFVEPEAYDYNLDDESPCIDAGLTTFVFEGDTLLNLSEGEYIGEMPDIGSFEYDPLFIADDNPASLLSDFNLLSIYPNPFNSTTTIKYTKPTGSDISIRLYGQDGRLVRVLKDGFERRGVHATTINGNDLPSGIYFVMMSAGMEALTQKVLLIR